MEFGHRARIQSLQTIARTQTSSTHILSPDHGFLEGSRVSLEGFPELIDLQGKSLHVSFWHDIGYHHSPQWHRDRLTLEVDVKARVARVDIDAGILWTQEPHGITSGDVEVHARTCDDQKRVFKYHVIEGDGNRVALGCYVDPIKSDFGYRDQTRDELEHTPTKDLTDSLVGGEIVAVMRPFDLKQLAKFCISKPAKAIVASPKYRSHQECVADWRQSLHGVQKHGVHTAKVQVKQDPPFGRLLVSCRGHSCSGEYRRVELSAGQCVYVCGVVRIEFVRELQSWCLLANIRPCIGLAMEREELGLEKHWEGPHLLYICRGASPCDQWEPVLGRYPAPVVVDTPAINASANLISLAFGGMLPKLDMVEIHAHVFGWLFDLASSFSNASWRTESENLSGPTLARQLVELMTDHLKCIAVSKAWQEVLKKYCSPQACRNALLELPPGSSISSIKCMDVIRMLCMGIRLNSAKDDIFAITQSDVFQSNSWGARVVTVNLESAVTHGTDGTDTASRLMTMVPAFGFFARRLLDGLPLFWNRHPLPEVDTKISRIGHVTRRINFCNVRLLGHRCEELGDKNSHLLVRGLGRHGATLTSIDGAELFSYSQLKCALEHGSLRITSVSRAFSWKVDVKTRTIKGRRTWSAGLSLQLKLIFGMEPHGSADVALVIGCECRPFHFCSRDQKKDVSRIADFIRCWDNTQPVVENELAESDNDSDTASSESDEFPGVRFTECSHFGREMYFESPVETSGTEFSDDELDDVADEEREEEDDEEEGENEGIEV